MTYKSVIGGGIIVVVNIISLFFYNYVLNLEGFSTVAAVGPFIYWIVFYYIGVLLSNSTRDYSLVIPLSFIIIGFILQLFETYYLMTLDKVGVGIKISSWLYSAGVILLLFSNNMEEAINKNSILYKVFVYLGKISFGIYLTHVYFLMVKGNIILTDNWIFSFVFVAISTTLFVMVIRKLLPASMWKILGLK